MSDNRLQGRAVARAPRRWRTCFAAAIASIAAHFLHAVHAAEIRDAAVYGALPHVSETAISPDGRTIAQIQALGGGKRAVVFIDIDGKATPVGMNLGDAKARGLVWGGDDHVMVLVSAAVEESFGDGLKTYEIWRWVVIDRAAKTKAILFKSSRYGSYWFGSGSIECFGGQDPRSIVLAHQGNYSLYTIDLVSGSEKLKQLGADETYDWVLNSACEPVVRLDYDFSSEEIRFYAAKPDGKGFEFKSAMKSKLGDDDAIVQLGALAQSGQFAGLALDGDLLTLRQVDLEAGVFKRGSESAPGFDLSSVIVDPYTDTIVSVYRYNCRHWAY